MKLSIRMKIFLPVMVLLIAFPMTVWIMVRYALDVHMNYNARRSLDWAIERSERILEEDTGFLQEFGAEIPPGSTDLRMMAVNDGYQVLYPMDFVRQPEMIELYTMLITETTGEEDLWISGETAEEMIGEEKYLLYFQCLDEDNSDGIRYLLLYCPIYDASGIMEQVSGFVFLTVLLMAAVFIVLFWFVAGSISGPVIRLCEAARGIGEKKFRKVETGATVKELCQLENEINQMQEKLSQADQAERTFFQNASHELRTPLMSISGYAQGIQCGIFDDVPQAAGVILDESTRLTEVVDGILTLTRMDQMRYQVVPVELGLNAFLEERIELLEGFAYSQSKKIVFSEGEEHVLTTDVMLLERAFSNVVSNCIRYAKETVTVEVEAKEEFVVITVADDGPGIRPEDAEHIFDRFYKGKSGNHGLGLAIAKCSLEYIGGTVLAASGTGGAVFRLHLPYDCRSFAMENWK